MSTLRTRLGTAVFARVAGNEGPHHRREIHESDGPRWFADDRPIRAVHGDASMFVGGLRALLLQSLHPAAMAGVAEHSDYRNDPWGRLQRTSYFLAVTTFGPAEAAERAIARVRSIHRHVQGTSADGVAYSAQDPHLLRWVHLTEADSFLRAYQRYGAHPLDQPGRDGYVADIARVGAAMGVPDPPRTEAELHRQLEGYLPELRTGAQARAAARFLLWRAPVPLLARGPYAVLAAAAIDLLPWRARALVALPAPPLARRAVVRPAAQVLVRSLRWAMSGPLSGDPLDGAEVA